MKPHVAYCFSCCTRGFNSLVPKLQDKFEGSQDD